MFTDLVASTEMMVRLGEAVAYSLRAEFLSLSRDAALLHGGREVKNLGDGLMLVFPSASAAVAGGVAMQQALVTRNRRSLEALELRVGVAVGDVDVDADDDYFGAAVVEAARLCGAAGGGEILVTQTVRLLARDRGGTDFEDVGELNLKGLNEGVEASRVLWTATDPGSEGVLSAVPARIEQMSGGVFVGRGCEVGLIGQMVKEAEGDSGPRVVLVNGEAGIGKSTLVAHVARAAAEAGSLVILGHCSEEATAAFRPWREVFGGLVGSMPDHVLESHVATHGLVLAMLVPLLPERVGRRAPTLGDDPQSERYALFSAALDLLVRASAEMPLVAVLDDLHWADPPSLALLRHVAKSAEPIRLSVLGTFRDADVVAGSALADTLAELHREQGVERLRLRGLDDLALLELLAELAGGDLPADAADLRDALAAETDGNPFFVAEILRHLTETGALFSDADGNWNASPDLRDQGLPVSVREVIGQRVSRLGDPTHRVLSHAAVIGREFDLDLLAEVVDSDVDVVLDLVELALGVGLVEDISPGVFSFTHALVEHALYEELTPTRRSRIHRAVAVAIEASTDDVSEAAASLARHWTAATIPHDAHRAVQYAAMAGDQALDQLAPEEALRWYSQALEQLDRAPDDPTLRCRLLIGLGESQRQTGDSDHLAVLLAAADLAIDLGDADLQCDAATAAYGGLPTIKEPVPDRLRVLEQAAATSRGQSTARRSQILACLSGALVLIDAPRARDLAREAIQIARGLDNNELLAWTIVRSFWAFRAPDTAAERDQLSREALALADAIGNPVLTWHANLFAAHRAEELGDVDALAAHVDSLFGIAHQVGQPLMMSTAWRERCAAAMIAGRLDESLEAASKAFEYGTAAGVDDSFDVFGAQWGTISLMRGGTDALTAIDMIGPVAAANPAVPGYRAGLAAGLASTGQLERATEILSQDIDTNFCAYRLGPQWTTGMHYCAESISLLGLPEPAEVLIEMIEPYADVVATGGMTCYEVLHHSMGELLTVVGRYDEADDQFAKAEAKHQSMRAPFFVTRTRLSWADMLIRRRGPGDLDRAAALVDAARYDAGRHSHANLIERANRLTAQLHDLADDDG